MRNPVQLVSAVIVAASLGTAASAQESIKIGFHAPLTGFAAADGKSARQGAELAVKEANAAGGIGGFLLPLCLGGLKDLTGTYATGLWCFVVAAGCAFMTVVAARRRAALVGREPHG